MVFFLAASVVTSIAVLFGICSIQFEENMKANNYLADSPFYVAAFATFLTLIAIAVDMALYVRAVDVFNSYFAGIKTQPGPGSSTSYSPTLTSTTVQTYCVIHSVPSRLFNRFLDDLNLFSAYFHL
jgi:hypothetical protein